MWGSRMPTTWHVHDLFIESTVTGFNIPALQTDEETFREVREGI